MHDLDQEEKLSKNFTRKEFACKCGCGFSSPDPIIVEVVQFVREYFNKRTSLNSSCRCKSHNKSVGGAENSTHLYGLACDIDVDGVEPATVYRLLDKTFPDKFGIGQYKSFTHVDIRNKRARW